MTLIKPVSFNDSSQYLYACGCFKCILLMGGCSGLKWYSGHILVPFLFGISFFIWNFVFCLGFYFYLQLCIWSCDVTKSANTRQMTWKPDHQYFTVLKTWTKCMLGMWVPDIYQVEGQKQNASFKNVWCKLIHLFLFVGEIAQTYYVRSKKKKRKNYLGKTA